MSNSPSTRASLVIRLRNPADADAWRQFVEIYAPLIHSFGMHRGLQDADAADLVQEVLQSVAKHAGRFDYDPTKGSYRGWIFTITRNKLKNRYARAKGVIQGSGGSTMYQSLQNQADDDEETESLWNREHQRHVFNWTAAKIRDEFQPQTWDAFWLTAVDGVPPSEVAARLNMSVGAVYIAKSRVLTRFREVSLSIDDEH